MAGQVDDSDLDTASEVDQIAVPKPAVNGQLRRHLFQECPFLFLHRSSHGRNEGDKERVKASAVVLDEDCVIPVYHKLGAGCLQGLRSLLCGLNGRG